MYDIRATWVSGILIGTRVELCSSSSVSSSSGAWACAGGGGGGAGAGAGSSFTTSSRGAGGGGMDGLGHDVMEAFDAPSGRASYHACTNAKAARDFSSQDSAAWR